MNVSVNAKDLLRAWAEDLAAWRIPEHITAKAEHSPWVLPEEVFTRRAERYLAQPEGPSYRLAVQALGDGGTVLDVGAGAGAASLPLIAHTTALTAVDQHLPMLDWLAERAATLGLGAHTVCGRWPDIADRIAPADVVLCHHVLYNVADLEPFVVALTNHARRLVIAEITVRHPLTQLNPYWQEFHGLTRPAGPTADDAIKALQALGLDVQAERWTRTPSAEYATFAALLDVTRRRLCLPPERAGDLAAALRRDGVHDHIPPDLGSSGRELVTLWWAGTAQPDR